jgi:alkanesulfonate monooxygenase SsuD/methylene tetrahydromethanopterin reductase-like flavin-dependent oxidoreductase (luciferase family)
LGLPNDLAWRTQLSEWRGLLLGLPDAVAASLERDHRRGQAIFDDYGVFHGQNGPSDEAVVKRMGGAVQALVGFLEATPH